jgi:hypothetical protein
MSATPRASANQRIGGQACGAAIDAVRRPACPSFNVNDHDLTVGRNQDHHDRALPKNCPLSYGTHERR